MQGAHADAQGILLSFYSSAAVFVNGKCACFLPGFLGRAQKSPGRGGTIENGFRLRSSHIQRKNYFYFRASGASADAPLAHFHEEGSKGHAAFTAIKTKSPGGRVLSGERKD